MNQKFIFKVCPESSDLIYPKDTISELNATYGEGKNSQGDLRYLSTEF